MEFLDAQEAYKNALKAGQREYKELSARGLDPYPAVLDRRVENAETLSIQHVGVAEIPIERIVGTKSEGRTSAFSAGFMPLLDSTSEFALKWIRLCAEHLSDTGIRDPIECFEYLGDFYVQEGNKRLSVLKYFGAASIAANVKRVLPAPGDEWMDVYIGIPFCTTRCAYCSFSSGEIGNGKLVAPYMKALIREMAAAAIQI